MTTDRRVCKGHQSAPLFFNAEVRLRGYDATATGSPWVKPVWLLPAAQPTAAAAR